MKHQFPQKNISQMREKEQSHMLNILVLLMSVLFCLCVIFVYAWFMAYQENNRLDIHKLSREQRQMLLGQLVDHSPGIFRYFRQVPDIGYTLKVNVQLQAWGDTFRSNELGYRTKSIKKGENVFRIVFVGDSWTYGMGVSEKESFPYQFEMLANNYSGAKDRIEAWTLALPGYNTVNQVAALHAFSERIKPDVIVLCPTTNDIDGTLGVSQKGRTIENRFASEPFLGTKGMPIDSYLTRTLWEQVFKAIHQTISHFGKKSVPFFLFFVARWDPPMVHALLQRTDIQVPYSIVPIKYTVGKWQQPPEKYGHGTPEAHSIYARILYHMIAEHGGWSSLPEKVTAPDDSTVLAYNKVPSGDWDAQRVRILRQRTQEQIPYVFVAGSKNNVRQCFGAMNCKTGEMARSTVLLVRRKPNSSHLRIFVKRVAHTKFLYPLALTISLPSPSRGIRQDVEISERGPDMQELAIPIPQDIPPDTAIDVIFKTPRAVVNSNFSAMSLYITRIDQE